MPFALSLSMAMTVAKVFLVSFPQPLLSTWKSQEHIAGIQIKIRCRSGLLNRRDGHCGDGGGGVNDIEGSNWGRGMEEGS